MAQVKGRLRPLTTRLSSERVPSEKYSTLWPSRSDSPAAAMRAMPISLGVESRSESGRSGREPIGTAVVRYLFAYDIGTKSSVSSRVEGARRAMPDRRKGASLRSYFAGCPRADSAGSGEKLGVLRLRRDFTSCRPATLRMTTLLDFT